MSNRKHVKIKFFRVRMVIIVIALCVFLAQMIEGTKMIASYNPLPTITEADYDNLTSGAEVKGAVRKVVFSYPDEVANCYAAITPNRRILLFRTVAGTEIDSQMQELLHKQRESVSYRGRVRNMSENGKTLLDIHVVMNNAKKAYNLQEGVGNHLTNQSIDITNEADEFPMKAVVLTFVGAALMLALAAWLSLKPLNNLIYNIQVQRGKIEPELKITKDDIKIENMDDYSSIEGTEYFYVNNEAEDIAGTKPEAEAPDLQSISDDAPIDPATVKPDDIKTKPDESDGYYYSSGVNESGSFYVNSDGDDGYNSRPHY